MNAEATGIFAPTAKPIAVQQKDAGRLAGDAKTLMAVGRTADVVQILDDALTSTQRRYAEIRKDPSLNDEYRRHQLAKVYVQARESVDTKMHEQAAKVVRTDQHDAEHVFGIAGLAGDVASLTMSRRDAADRVAAANPDDLYDMLLSALRVGDEIMARALVERAVEDRDSRSVNTFLEQRPQYEAPLERLWDVSASELDLAWMQLAFSKLSGLTPPEFKTVSEARMAAAAEPALAPKTWDELMKGWNGG